MPWKENIELTVLQLGKLCVWEVLYVPVPIPGMFPRLFLHSNFTVNSTVARLGDVSIVIAILVTIVLAIVVTIVVVPIVAVTMIVVTMVSVTMVVVTIVHEVNDDENGV